MRRYPVLLITLLMMTLLTVPASAKKGGGGNGPPDPIVGMTCAEMNGESTPVEWIGEKTFTVALTSRDGACVDIDDVGAGDWTVAVEVGSARAVTVQLRSSVPGDWCWSASTQVDTQGEFSSPASTENACPNGGAGGESIPDDNSALAFTAFYTGGKKLTSQPIVTVTLP